MSLIYRIAISVLIVPVFWTSVNAQTENLDRGVTIKYLSTISDGGKVKQATIAPTHYFNGKSIFLLRYGTEDSFNQESKENGSMKVQIQYSDKMGRSYFVNQEGNEIVSKEIIFDESINVREPIPVFNWIISGKEKDIAGYTCYGATASFRGRNFVAWFAPEIPLNVGPWKFSGLPGAILEVNDVEGAYNWYCKSVNRLTNESKEKIKAPPGKKMIGFPAFQNLFEEKFMALLNKATASPNVHITSKPNFDNSLERKLK